MVRKVVAMSEYDANNYLAKPDTPPNYMPKVELLDSTIVRDVLITLILLAGIVLWFFLGLSLV
jgi:hypothetical protein